MLETSLIFLVLLVISGLSSATELAYFSLGSGRVRTMVRQGLMGAHLVERLKAKPRRLLVTILLVNNLVNILAAALATELAIAAFGSRGVGIATGVVTFLILVFGEIFPKTFAQYHAERFSRFGAPFVLLITWILRPVTWVLERTMDALSLSQPESSRHREIELAEEEIQSLFQIGVEQGTLAPHEKAFVERLFRFNDLPVSTVVKPLSVAVMMDGEMPISKAAELAASSGYSRFLVYRDTQQNVVGVVHIKSIMRANVPSMEQEKLITLAHPPVVMPHSQKLNEVFKLMAQHHTHYVLVTSEHGGLAGFATLEDVLEELVGEIQDESDREKIAPAL